VVTYLAKEKIMEKEKTGLLQLVGFTPCFDFISVNYGNTVGMILGKIWRFSKMSDSVCKASRQRIASELGIGLSTVQRAISVLEEIGIIQDITPTLKHRPHSYRVYDAEIIRQNKLWLKEKRG
jgi:hypothetical protein